MSNQLLYSVVLELTATNQATIPAAMGHQAHALFLDLIRQVEPEISTRLHDQPNYRPFTVSPLNGGRLQGTNLSLKSGQTCRLRITLLDGGTLWHHLTTYFLENGKVELRLGTALLKLDRLMATPAADPTGWANFTDWQTLAATPARPYINLRFASPTTFHLGNRQFALFPEPLLVWESLVRVWNLYAPEILQIDKAALSEFLKTQVLISDYELQTATLQFPSHPQKGFIGVCTYKISHEASPLAAQLAALAEFSLYAGVGYKTTMGLGQLRSEK